MVIAVVLISSLYFLVTLDDLQNFNLKEVNKIWTKCTYFVCVCVFTYRSYGIIFMTPAHAGTKEHCMQPEI